MANQHEAFVILILAASLTGCGKSGNGPAQEQKGAGVEQAANNLAAPGVTPQPTAVKSTLGVSPGVALASKLSPIGAGMSSSGSGDGGSNKASSSASFRSPLVPGTSLGPSEQ